MRCWLVCLWVACVHLPCGLASESAAPTVVVPAQLPAFEPSPDEPEPEPEPAPGEYEPPPAPFKINKTAPQSKYRWPLWRILSGGALAAGGGVMLGIGISAFAYDGFCVPTPKPGVECRRYYDTKNYGIALTTSGALSIVGGLLLVAIPSRRTKPQKTETVQISLFAQ